MTTQLVKFDKEMLLNFADELCQLSVPLVESPAARAIVNKAMQDIREIADNLKIEAREM